MSGRASEAEKGESVRGDVLDAGQGLGEALTTGPSRNSEGRIACMLRGDVFETIDAQVLEVGDIPEDIMAVCHVRIAGNISFNGEMIEKVFGVRCEYRHG